MDTKTEDFVIVKLPNMFQSLLVNYLKKRFDVDKVCLTESSKQTQLFRLSIDIQEEVLTSIGKFFSIYIKSSYFKSEISKVPTLDIPSFIWFWYKSCQNKQAYETEEACQWYNQHLSKMWGVNYRIYRCDFCSKYHLTTKVD